MAKPTLTHEKTKILGANLARWRKKRKLTPSEASSRLRKARTYVHGLETATFTPSLAALHDISKLYNCKISDLVRGL